MKHILLLLALSLLHCRLDTSGKTACDSNTDCASGLVCMTRVCVAAEPPATPTACTTHFECDTESICVKGTCQTYVVRTVQETLSEMANAICETLERDCGSAKMQERFGSQYRSECRRGYDANNVLPPLREGAFDPKLGAACALEYREYVEGSRPPRSSSFTGTPAPDSCFRMIDGAKSYGEDCATNVGVCHRGLVCGHLYSSSGVQQDICIGLGAKVDDPCVPGSTPDWRECDDGLYCDLLATKKCRAVLPIGAACQTRDPAVDCNSASAPISCQTSVDPCAAGSSCSLEGHCVADAPREKCTL